MPDIKIQPATSQDIPAIMELEGSCFSDEAWREEDFLYRLNESGYITLMAFCDGKPAGYITASSFFDISIDSVAVDTGFRRMGIASSLITAALQRGEKGGNAFLEVRKSNSGAKSLYKSLGFNEIGIRKGYYTNPDEDAVIMIKEGI